MSNTDSSILKPKFTLIEGGLNCSIPQAHKRFVSAYVTNTRLMGVLAVYAHWAVKDGGDIHQFFYIDCEETGLETCTVYRGDWNQEMQMAEQALVGGLGASAGSWATGDISIAKTTFLSRRTRTTTSSYSKSL